MSLFAQDQEVDANSPEDLRWWKVRDNEAAKSAFCAAKAILENNLNREEILWRNIRLYCGQVRDAYWGESAANPLAVNRAGTSTPYKVNRNVAASVTDTMVSMLSNTEIKTTVLSDGGDYSQTRKKSKKCERYLNGVKYNNKFNLVAPESLLSALVCDLGTVKVFEDEQVPGGIRVENIFQAEILIDELDGLHKAPRQIMQRKVVSRDVLLEMYSEVEDLEANLQLITPTGTGSLSALISDKVEVLEAWHLRSGPDAEDGRHIICIENTMLFEESWDVDHLPFAFLRPNLNMFGFYGIGVVTDLVGVQYEINALSAAKQRALYLGSNFMVLVPTGSKLNKNHLLNGMGLILEYTGEKPDWFTPSPVSPQIDTEIAGLIAWAYQRWGVSQLTAQSLKPDGLDSGEALRTYANIQSVRHSTLGKQYQQFHLDVDRLILMTARQIDARRKKARAKGTTDEGEEMSVRLPGEHHVETIKWKDADPGDGFIVKLYPTNLFADSPADRLAQMGDLAQKNLMDGETFLQLMDFPDLDVYRRIRLAPRENIFAQIDDILIEGKYRSPEPFQDLKLGCQLFQAALLDAEVHEPKVSDDKLAQLQRWIGEAKALLLQAMPPPPPPAPMPMPAAPPPPMAPMIPGPPPPAAGPIPPPA